MGNLHTWYSMDECLDKKKLFEKLDKLRDEGKIEYEKESLDIFKIEDIDLDELEVEDLVETFDKYDVFPYLDKDDDDDDYNMNNDDYNDYDENY